MRTIKRNNCLTFMGLIFGVCLYRNNDQINIFKLKSMSCHNILPLLQCLDGVNFLCVAKFELIDVLFMNAFGKLLFTFTSASTST
jgi:hypothetical protein